MAAETRTEAPAGAGLTGLPGIGPRRALALRRRFGAETPRDLLLACLPRGYEPAAVVLDGPGLAELAPSGGAAAAASADGPPLPDRVRLRGRVRGARLWPPAGPRAVLRVDLVHDDEPHAPFQALWFGRPWLRERMVRDAVLHLEGRPSLHQGRLRLLSPRLLDPEEAAAPPRPRPRLPEVEGVPPAVLAAALRAALAEADEVPDPLPEDLRRAAGVPDLATALRALYEPSGPEAAAAAEAGRRRLALGEAWSLAVGRGDDRPPAPVPPRLTDPVVWERIRRRLPFRLAPEQEAVLAEIRRDLVSGRALRRLLHGEVGSGKTVVAFAAALAVIAGGGQVALLAPTEVLARQHLRTFRGWLRGSRVRLVGVLGEDDAARRSATRDAIAAGAADLVVGTHALCRPELRFADLRLVVFDEQQRFGVRQKAALTAKGAPGCHVLTMTATPIPRTLAWLRHGALDASLLRERRGGGRVRTSIHPTDQALALAAAMRPALERGERAFLVAPRLDGPFGLRAWVERLAVGPWRGLELAVVHGRLRGADLEARLERFRSGAAAVLCGTTVVEVGLDVPDVRHMLVVGGERLGLASLHQLRGRLARGADAGDARFRVCAALEAHARLAVLAACADGFAVAAADLRERGPGELRGLRQHGVGGFQAFDPLRDDDLLEAIRAHRERSGSADPG